VRRAVVWALLFTGLPMSCAPPSDQRPSLAGALHVEDAAVRVLPSRVGALYLRIINESDHDDRLTGVDSPEVQDAQLHEVVQDHGDVMTMRAAQDGFAVPARSVVALEHGGKHVMLFGISPKADTVSLTLHFERAGDVHISPTCRSGVEESP
jgi:copper(I)-binding protein